MTERVDFWFDCVCPWAWMTSRWMDEVVAIRDVEVVWHPMSLSVLNEDRDIPENYRALMDRAWLPARVVTAAMVEHGQEVVKPLYDAIGTRIHPDGRNKEDLVVLVAEALAEVGLPESLLEAADGRYDEQLRASHAEGIAKVGQDVGTPVIAVEDTAFFGPVVTPIPRGEAAGKLWDGVLLIARTPGFYELKRTRDADPSFE